MVTLVAYEVDTVNDEEDPDVIETGFAVMLTLGAGFGVTVNVAAAVALPFGPVAVAV
jgi:hypothetical protein